MHVPGVTALRHPEHCTVTVLMSYPPSLIYKCYPARERVQSPPVTALNSPDHFGFVDRQHSSILSSPSKWGIDLTENTRRRRSP
jgi:hypothetical protein